MLYSPTVGPSSAFTESHWQALLALLDAVVPSIVEAGTASPSQDHVAVPSHELRRLYQKSLCGAQDRFNFEEFCHFMASRPSEDPNFVNTVKRALGRLAPGPKYQLRFILDFMLTRFGSIISTGYWTPFSEQPLPIRVSILQSWQQSWFFLWPSLARIFITISKACWSQTNQLFLQLNGYKHYSDDAAPGPSAEFNFIQFPESVEPALIKTDVVIVGSGCGGAVCAKVLAEAGLQVLVVERGYHFSPDNLPMELHRTDNVFQGGGGLPSADGSTLVTAGQCWGGGGTVNWSASLQTPAYIRDEWAQGGLTFFKGAGFQNSLDRVCDAMGVSDTTIQGNHSNRVLLEGAHKLGWRATTCPQNTGRAAHHCGSRCGLGCRTAKKQGPSTYWLPAAAQAGARFIEGFDVTQILFAPGGSSRTTGLIGQWTSRDEDDNPNSSKSRTRQMVEVQAKTVILAGGALNTPLLMMRSGLKSLTSQYATDHIIEPEYRKESILTPRRQRRLYMGSGGEILSSVVSEFEDLDGAGHGTKIEALAMQPYAAMLLHPWRSGLDFKASALHFRHNMTCHISLCRDRDAGSVSPEPSDGSPVINYTPSKFDRAHIATGLVGIAKLCYILGARELAPAVPDVPYFECLKPVEERHLNDRDFANWLRLLERTNLDPLRTTFNSAHQMGTARMGTKAETSVVDENSRVWGCEGLYVADASVFPSASGVNPMITVMAIADHIARGIAVRLA
ncbi:FAD/NAD(P)-binding domain-containing protein [Xylaria longipes]|nr:FAD/NAD(P)-binding domain-containing protein [Xylaria longipes]